MAGTLQRSCSDRQNTCLGQRSRYPHLVGSGFARKHVAQRRYLGHCHKIFNNRIRNIEELGNSSENDVLGRLESFSSSWPELLSELGSARTLEGLQKKEWRHREVEEFAVARRDRRSGERSTLTRALKAPPPGAGPPKTHRVGRRAFPLCSKATPTRSMSAAEDLLCASGLPRSRRSRRHGAPHGHGQSEHHGGVAASQAGWLRQALRAETLTATFAGVRRSAGRLLRMRVRRRRKMLRGAQEGGRASPTFILLAAREGASLMCGPRAAARGDLWIVTPQHQMAHRRCLLFLRTTFFGEARRGRTDAHTTLLFPRPKAVPQNPESRTSTTPTPVPPGSSATGALGRSGWADDWPGAGV